MTKTAKEISLEAEEITKFSTHEAMKKIINFNGIEYAVDMVKSLKVRENASFLLSRIRVGDKILWSFRDEQFDGLAKREEVCGMPVICLMRQSWKDSKQKFTIVRIIPFEDLHNLQRVMVNGEMQVVTSRDISEIIRLKNELSVQLKIPVEFSELENKAYEIIIRKKAEEKEKIRQEKISAILSRLEVTGYTQDGLNKYGHPVVGDEWQMLPEGTFVVLVESYNNETNECGNLLEAFAVSTIKGKKEKKNASPVFKEPVISEKKVVEGRVALFEINGVIKPVVIYKSMEDIHAVRQAGLNGGTVVATEAKDDKGRHQLYAVSSDKIDTVGYSFPL